MAHYFKSIPRLVPLEQSQEYSQQIANLQEIYVERERGKKKNSNKRRGTKISCRYRKRGFHVKFYINILESNIEGGRGRQEST